MEPDDPAPYLALNRIPGLGPLTAGRLLEAYGDAAGILAQPAAEWRHRDLPAPVVRGLTRPDWRGVQKDLDWLSEHGGRFVSRADPRYPLLLREIPDPPLGLFLLGDAQCLAQMSVAVVGSRNPTAAGRRQACELAAGLAACGITVTSGLATGIDSAAHTGALDGGGATVAVLGSGLDRIYPPRNRDLARRIADHGLLLSEFPPDTPPRAGHFPRRNRIISGLSAGVVVVEAARRSGSLISARYAMEQGREVFAVPGSVANPLSRGCHALIRQGAKLTETVDDILEEIGSFTRFSPAGNKPDDYQPDNRQGLDHSGQLLLDNIGYAPIHIDVLIDLTRIPVDEISEKMLDLEMRGLIESVAGGAYVRRD